MNYRVIIIWMPNHLRTNIIVISRSHIPKVNRIILTRNFLEFYELRMNPFCVYSLCCNCEDNIITL